MLLGFGVLIGCTIAVEKSYVAPAFKQLQRFYHFGSSGNVSLALDERILPRMIVYCAEKSGVGDIAEELEPISGQLELVAAEYHACFFALCFLVLKVGKLRSERLAVFFKQGLVICDPKRVVAEREHNSMNCSCVMSYISF